MKTDSRIYLLSLDHPEIGAEEVVALTRTALGKPPSCFQAGDLLMVQDSVSGLGQRLAYAKAVCKVVAEATPETLAASIKGIDWNRHIKGSFKAEIRRARNYMNAPVELSESELGAMLYENLESPSVSLENPDTTFTLFVAGEKLFLSLLEEKVPTDFMQRRPHLRPVMHPSSIHPRLARACVNLTGLLSGTIMDPFCGTGGILIEAGLLGFSIKGCDIKHRMIEACEKNLNHYNLKAELFVGDALAAELNADAIVTDIPYGRNTTLTMDAAELVNSFLSRETTAKRMVLMIPDTLQPEKIRYGNWLLEKQFTHYIHKSLSKRILVLKKN
ncbi:hypothetical protein D6764_03675 [Candidatus Woesearchaeota archaeon]|nr:MAG: hypothetical protein D6764_03675 [Candidatus Woesearchaeota archaeon]